MCYNLENYSLAYFLTSVNCENSFARLKMVKTKKRIILYFILVIIILVLTSFYTENDSSCKECDSTNETKIELENARNREDLSKKFYTILEYTKISGNSRFCKSYLDDNLIEPFKSDDKFGKIFLSNREGEKNYPRYYYLDNCEFKNCFFTCNNDLAHSADALVLSYGDLNRDLYSNSKAYNDLVSKRNPRQIWMLWNDEASVPLKKYDYLNFNWSVTFYAKSEVPSFAYGGFVNVENDDTLITIETINQEFKKRSNIASWFVSNCASTTRNKFASKLGNYYPINVGGSCASKIKGSKITHEKSTCERDSECETNDMKSKKFYLAFESTNCSDYITEKFWRSLSFGLIPIVIQPSKISYERIAPPNSFIHAQDFNFDAQLLANYLNEVSNNEELYSKHLKWKILYKNYYKGHDVDPFRLCQMCKKLNQETTSIYYKSLSRWTQNKCYSP